jgi:hypothetical protein
MGIMLATATTEWLKVDAASSIGMFMLNFGCCQVHVYGCHAHCLTDWPRVDAAAGIGMLMLNYVGAIALAFSNPAAFNMPIMVGAHAVLATILLLRAWKLAAAGYTKEAVANFYRWIWNLFYSEYLLLPIL